ncbi:MAG: histidinol dehydrogenase [Spirochaeta sp.]|jgi:histidinol dehydrogenase|nr:histidinol dehydrogenase [Spirochaeta sp.]
MSIQRFEWSALDNEQRSRILRRSQSDIDSLRPTVTEIVETVRRDGDAALLRYAGELDGAELAPDGIAVRPAEFSDAAGLLSAEVRAALEYAVENVRRFHRSQVDEGMTSVQVRDGIIATERSTPIDSVGLYVPSGRGSFPSMLYMLAVPAVLAGVGTIAVTTPPRPDGTVDPAVLYAAHLCGVDRVYRVGGAVAVAALTWGTETVPAVRKIVGPGSAYVAAAKRVVADLVDVGLPAGPSESIVLADHSADPHLVALDLMIEAEHGSDSSALLVTDDTALADAVAEQIAEILPSVPEPRRTFLTDVFSGYGGIIVTASLEESTAVVNTFAPEHLMLHTADPRALAARITNAAEILIGPHTAFSLANYATGPNAVLPTGGWAHTWSPVSVRDFRKTASIIEVTPEGYREMRDHVIALADHEGFYSHAAALRNRTD